MVRLLYRTCPWKSNALPSHPFTVCLQVHLKDDSLLSSDDNLAVFLIVLWVLEVAFQVNTSFEISGAEVELERDHTCDMPGGQHHRRNDSG